MAGGPCYTTNIQSGRYFLQGWPLILTLVHFFFSTSLGCFLAQGGWTVAVNQYEGSEGLYHCAGYPHDNDWILILVDRTQSSKDKDIHDEGLYNQEHGCDQDYLGRLASLDSFTSLVS